MLATIFPNFATLTHQCELKGDCPSDAYSDEGPNKRSKPSVDTEDPLVEQKDADLVQAYTRPDKDLKSVRCLTRLPTSP